MSVRLLPLMERCQVCDEPGFAGAHATSGLQAALHIRSVRTWLSCGNDGARGAPGTVTENRSFAPACAAWAPGRLRLDQHAGKADEEYEDQREAANARLGHALEQQAAGPCGEHERDRQQRRIDQEGG